MLCLRVFGPPRLAPYQKKNIKNQSVCIIGKIKTETGRNSVCNLTTNNYCFLLCHALMQICQSSTTRKMMHGCIRIPKSPFLQERTTRQPQQPHPQILQLDAYASPLKMQKREEKDNTNCRHQGGAFPSMGMINRRRGNYPTERTHRHHQHHNDGKCRVHRKLDEKKEADNVKEEGPKADRAVGSLSALHLGEFHFE